MLLEALDFRGRCRRRAFAAAVKNKRAVLVGPAASIQGTRQAETIDRFDLVVRLNRALPIPESLRPDIGTRCDVLFHCLYRGKGAGVSGEVAPPEPQMLVEHGVRLIYCPYPKNHFDFRRFVRAFEQTNRGAVALVWASRASFAAISKQLGYRPTSGYAAIHHLLDAGIGELYIAGMTFMQDGYQKQYANLTGEQAIAFQKSHGFHNPQREFDHFCATVADHSCVRLDDALAGLVRRHHSRDDIRI